ncbi:MAG: hypothetical protein CVU89_06750 [Firmicutes bacterium HGW-Firmicutes-14]|nr:MAG: hypothetical protein CVU89_06750 [Firmicutes bacterium HGW-Firmicutes-14]
MTLRGVLKNVRLLSTVLIVEILVVYFFFYLPVSTNLTAEKALVTSLENQVQDITAENNSKPQPERPQKTLPEQLESEKSLSLLNKLAEDNRVRVIQVTQDKPVTAGEVRSLGINLILEGARDDVIEFISQVENQPRLCTISSLQLQSLENGLRGMMKVTVFAMGQN